MIGVTYSAFWDINNITASGNNITLGTGVLDETVQPVFVSTDVTNLNFLYLAETTPVSIMQGASDGGFIGAAAIIPVPATLYMLGVAGAAMLLIRRFSQS